MLKLKKSKNMNLYSLQVAEFLDFLRTLNV